MRTRSTSTGSCWCAAASTTRRRARKLIAQEVELFEPSPEEVLRAAEEAAAEPVVQRLTLHVSRAMPDSFLEELKEVVGHHRGDHEILLAVGERRLLLGTHWRVSADSACRAELSGLAGAARLIVCTEHTLPRH